MHSSLFNKILSHCAAMLVVSRFVLPLMVLLGVALPTQAASVSTSYITDEHYFSGSRQTGIASDSQGRIYLTYAGDALYVATLSDGSWAVATVDAASYFTDPSLAIDTEDALHVSYYDTMDGTLKYARSTDGLTWMVTTIVDGSDKYGTYSSIAVKDGRVYIAYYDESNTDLKYATSIDGKTWMLTTIESTDDVGQYASLDVDASGKIYVAYYDATNRKPKSAHSDDGNTWTITTIDSVVSGGQYTSLKVDSSARIHVSYLANKTLKYAMFDDDDGKWTTTTVATKVAGTYSRLILDGDTIRIVHQDASNEDLKYSVSTDGSTWTTTTLATSERIGYYPAIVMTNGSVGIACFDATNQELRYGLVTEDSTWTPQAVDTSENSGSNNAVFIDGDGRLHVTTLNKGTNLMYLTSADGLSWSEVFLAQTTTGIGKTAIVKNASGTLLAVYYETASQTLKTLASQDGVTWMPSTIDVTTSTGGFFDVAVGTDGRFHAIYRREGTTTTMASAVMYAVSTDGISWTASIVVEEVGDDFGKYQSIAVDSSDKVHLVYGGNANLQYASSTDGQAWTIATVEGASLVGNTGLALGSDGQVHIFYYDPTNHQIDYARTTDGASWTLVVVENDVKVETSDGLDVAIDSFGRIHAAYYDTANANLKYADSLDGASWLVTTLDKGPAGDSPHIAITKNGNVRIMYRDGLYKDLKLAVVTTCGDGGIDHDQTCDDGNEISDDGCSAMCEIEVAPASTSATEMSTEEFQNGVDDSNSSADNNVSGQESSTSGGTDTNDNANTGESTTSGGTSGGDGVSVNGNASGCGCAMSATSGHETLPASFLLVIACFVLGMMRWRCKSARIELSLTALSAVLAAIFCLLTATASATSSNVKTTLNGLDALTDKVIPAVAKAKHFMSP